MCVQRKTPDDGQRNCPKHVDFYSQNKFEKLVQLVGFIIRTGQEIVKLVAFCEEILEEKSAPLSRQTSVIEFIKSSSRSFFWPPVLADTVDGEPYYLPAVSEERRLLQPSFACHFIKKVKFRLEQGEKDKRGSRFMSLFFL